MHITSIDDALPPNFAVEVKSVVKQPIGVMMKIFFCMLFLAFSLLLIAGALGKSPEFMASGAGGMIVTGLIVRALIGKS